MGLIIKGPPSQGFSHNFPYDLTMPMTLPPCEALRFDWNFQIDLPAMIADWEEADWEKNSYPWDPWDFPTSKIHINISSKLTEINRR